jgi:hypothetical protein
MLSHFLMVMDAKVRCLFLTTKDVLGPQIHFYTGVLTESFEVHFEGK